MNQNYCIFAAQYFPHLGGVERYTYHLAKELIRRGDQAVIVTSNVQRLPSYEKMDGIPVYRFPCINLLDGRFPVLWPGGDFRKIHRTLMKKHFDKVIVNTRFYPHSLYGVLFGRRQRAKTIVIDHGSSHLTVHNPFWDTVGGWYEHLFTGILKLLCKDYYGVSRASIQWLRHFHIQAKGALYNAIDLDEIQRRLANPVRNFREEYGIPDQADVITFTGRLLAEKGLLPLVQAFKKVRSQYPDTYLCIAGDGDLEEELKKQSDSHILLLGRLDSGEIVDLLGNSDIFCLPSVSEGFSTSLLEAAACKNYIVVTDSACPRELLPDDRYARILPELTEGSIQEGLLWALSHPRERQEAAARAYERLASHFTWKIVTDRIQKI